MFVELECSSAKICDWMINFPLTFACFLIAKFVFFLLDPKFWA